MNVPATKYVSAIVGALRIYLLAMAIGLLTGMLASGFHYCLDRAIELHARIASLLPGGTMSAVLVAALLGAVMALVAAVLVRRFAPEAAGSGVQEIEGALHGIRDVRWRRVIPVKFAGGVLSIGAGLFLGREGPTIHMGGCVGRMIGETSKVRTHVMNTLVAAGAGAGLSTAFSAPLAGVMFVIEEMRERFNYSFVSLHAVIIACVTAKVVNDQVFGMAPPLPLHIRSWMPVTPGPQEVFIFVPLFLLLGVVIGVCGVVFNEGLLGCLRFTDRLNRTSMLAAASVLGALAGALLVIAPESAGGGEFMIKSVFSSQPALGVVLALFAGRLLMTFFSYAAGVPGGIFAPMLALGTLIGIGFGSVAAMIFPHVGLHAGAFAIAAMGGLFAATVRAPLTGIVLVAELTASYELLTAMILTCLSASITAQLMGSKPVYELLLARTLGSEATAGNVENGGAEGG
ncbi:MAG TPA: H(+)/Cl(-) exchange transporter ClcA [Candidatus Krumholzibacteria bacterium]|nr:H(+)/Cl(-) exchange transporter ClcA [Candidatus Krumholzibacteria bacterium]